MTDPVRHGETLPDGLRNMSRLVTLDVVSRAFIAAGLPRSMRTLQRYCTNGTLDCVKEATDTGDTYFVAEPSIDLAIASLRQLHDAKNKSGHELGHDYGQDRRDEHRHGAPDHDMSFDVGPVSAPDLSDDTVGHGPTRSDNDANTKQKRQAMTTPDMSGPITTGAGTTGHVAQLEQRLEEKDEEIAFLREELIDRRGQIKDMKGIIDGQNQLLDTIQTNVAPIFKALASTVETQRIDLSVKTYEGDRTAGEPGSVHQPGREHAPDREQASLTSRIDVDDPDQSRFP